MQKKVRGEKRTMPLRLSLLPLPDAPVHVLLHEVTATFVRTPPLTLTAFDTGRGILLVAKARPKDYHDEAERSLQETSGGSVARKKRSWRRRQNARPSYWRTAGYRRPRLRLRRCWEA